MSCVKFPPSAHSNAFEFVCVNDLYHDQNRLFLASPHTWNGSFQYRFARVTSNGL